MLSVKKADVFYGRQQVLYQINLELESGVYGLIGENGAGKTTLIGLITGLLKAKNGTVEWNGSDIGSLKSSYYDNIGYLPQFPTLYSDFYPLDFLYYMALLKGMKKKDYIKKSKKLLDFVGLAKEEKKKIGAFSGGMRQRLGIAQALLNEPKLLILDEPTAGLDPSERIRFRNIITDLSKDRIVLLATHIISDIEDIARHILFLHKGKLIKSGSPEELIHEIEGKVFEAQVDEEQYLKLDKRLLCNAANVNSSFKIRGFISGVKGACLAAPKLEDVFLYQIIQDLPINEVQKNVKI